MTFGEARNALLSTLKTAAMDGPIEYRGDFTFDLQPDKISFSYNRNKFSSLTNYQEGPTTTACSFEILDAPSVVTEYSKNLGWKVDLAPQCGGISLIFHSQEEATTFALALGALKRSSERRNSVEPALAGGAGSKGPGGEPSSPATPVSDVDRPLYKLAERPDDYALVVGIEKYSDISAAQFAERDAEAVKDHLIAAGFPSRNVIQLFGEKAGRSAMEKFLETWLPRNVNANSRVFFYFSGHGAPDPRTGESYLIPWDGDPGFLENTGYPIKRLYEKLSALKAKEVIVAMDACFSGAGGRSVLAKGARPLVMKVDAATVPQNITVFAAASGDQITSTLEDQGHGTFTYYFLRGFSGGAKDASGRVTTKALYDYLKPKVQDAARRQNRDQEPVLHSQGDRELVRF